MTVVLDQKELCLHFIKFLETNWIALFPTLNTQWPMERISSRVSHYETSEFCIIMNTARDEIVSCDGCQEWFHMSCSNTKRSHL